MAGKITTTEPTVPHPYADGAEPEREMTAPQDFPQEVWATLSAEHRMEVWQWLSSSRLRIVDALHELMVTTGKDADKATARTIGTNWLIVATLLRASGPIRTWRALRAQYGLRESLLHSQKNAIVAQLKKRGPLQYCTYNHRQR